MDSNIPGIGAAVLVTIGCLWQLYKILKTKNVSAIKYPWLGLITISLGLWLVYGIYLNDWIIIIANAIVIGLYIVFMSLKYHYERKPKTRITIYMDDLW